LGAPARNRPLVPRRLTNRDKRPPFCHGSLHDQGLKGCLYIKAATLPLQHLATFSSPIRRHHRRRVLLLLLLCRCHPPRPLLSAATPVLYPRDSSQLPASRNPSSTDPPAPSPHRHGAGLPPSTPETRAAPSPTCPGLRGSTSPSSSSRPPPHPPPLHCPPRPSELRRRRAPCCWAGLRVVAYDYASTSSPHPAAPAVSLMVVPPPDRRRTPALHECPKF
jgi:hypothetical protein